MPITHRQGNKSIDDLKTSWNCLNCDYFEDVTFKDLAFIVTELSKNEDRLYPPEEGKLGGQMLIDYFQHCYDLGRVPDADIKDFRGLNKVEKIG